MTKYFSKHQIVLVFFNNYKIKNFINHKETLPKTFESMVVYLFSCPSCQLGYIGSTKKCIYSRYHEHKGTSSRTGRMLTHPLNSSIRDHCDMCRCSFSLEDFNILFRGSNETEIRIAESIFIKTKAPQLNQESASFPLKIA